MRVSFAGVLNESGAGKGRMSSSEYTTSDLTAGEAALSVMGAAGVGDERQIGSRKQR